MFVKKKKRGGGNCELHSGDVEIKQIKYLTIYGKYVAEFLIPIVKAAYKKKSAKHCDR